MGPPDGRRRAEDSERAGNDGWDVPLRQGSRQQRGKQGRVIGIMIASGDFIEQRRRRGRTEDLGVDESKGRILGSWVARPGSGRPSALSFLRSPLAPMAKPSGSLP